ncbi:MAG: lysophospholipid acyltransferase family protein [Rhodocyclaceae bacterium]|nr:MAG: lysophospholipid acyltransferase family protein [Rhodocyclaceae bacterium]
MRIVFRLLSLLPLPLLHALGTVAGWFVYLASPTYRRNLHANMIQALGEPLARVARAEAVAAAGRMVFELPRIWLHPIEKTVAMVREVRGWEQIEAAQAAGKGIVFLTPHLGCFEITAQYYAAQAPIAVLYRPPRYAVVQEMIEAGRARPMLKLAPADLSGVRSLIKSLRKGEAIGMLPDQAPKVGEGKWLPFFGRQAYTMTLAARLTETGATVLLAFGERLPGGAGFRLHFRPPLVPIEGDLETRARAINREIEALVREYPGQYLWGYNRYKRPRGVEPPPVTAGETV